MAVLALTACSASGSSDARPSTTTAEASTGSTERQTTTSTSTTTPLAVGIDDLTAVLPSAKEIGSDFVIVEPDDEVPAEKESSVFDEDSLAMCPELADIFAVETSEQDETTISFEETNTQRTFSANATMNPDESDPKTAQKEIDIAVAAINDCDAIVFDIGDDGYALSDINASSVDGFGDTAFRFSLDGQLFTKGQPDLISLQIELLLWSRGDVTASVLGQSVYSDGAVTGTQAGIPLDMENLEAVAKDFDLRIADLLG